MSANSGTNLLIADIVMRGASTLLRRGVEEQVAETASNPDADTANDEPADDALDGRAILTTVALYGASKLATRSVPGLAIVAGGLVLKALYDRGKERQLREADQELLDQE